MEVYRAMILFPLYSPKRVWLGAFGRASICAVTSLIIHAAHNQNALTHLTNGHLRRKSKVVFVFLNELHFDPKSYGGALWLLSAN